MSGCQLICPSVSVSAQSGSGHANRDHAASKSEKNKKTKRNIWAGSKCFLVRKTNRIIGWKKYDQRRVSSYSIRQL